MCFLLGRADMEGVRACSCILILFRINDSIRIYLGECGPNPVIGSRSVMKKEYVATELRSRSLTVKNDYSQVVHQNVKAQVREYVL